MTLFPFFKPFSVLISFLLFHNLPYFQPASLFLTIFPWPIFHCLRYFQPSSLFSTIFYFQKSFLFSTIFYIFEHFIYFLPSPLLSTIFSIFYHLPYFLPSSLFNRCQLSKPLPPAKQPSRRRRKIGRHLHHLHQCNHTKLWLHPI